MKKCKEIKIYYNDSITNDTSVILSNLADDNISFGIEDGRVFTYLLDGIKVVEKILLYNEVNNTCTLSSGSMLDIICDIIINGDGNISITDIKEKYPKTEFVDVGKLLKDLKNNCSLKLFVAPRQTGVTNNLKDRDVYLIVNGNEPFNKSRMDNYKKPIFGINTNIEFIKTTIMTTERNNRPKIKLALDNCEIFYDKFGDNLSRRETAIKLLNLLGDANQEPTTGLYIKLNMVDIFLFSEIELWYTI